MHQKIVTDTEKLIAEITNGHVKQKKNSENTNELNERTILEELQLSKILNKNRRKADKRSKILNKESNKNEKELSQLMFGNPTFIKTPMSSYNT